MMLSKIIIVSWGDRHCGYRTSGQTEEMAQNSIRRRNWGAVQEFHLGAT